MARSVQRRPRNESQPRLDDQYVLPPTGLRSNVLDYQQVFEQYAAGDDRGVLLLNSRRHVLEMNSVGREVLDYRGNLPRLVSDVIRDVKVGFAVGDAIHDRRPVSHEAFLPDPDRILRFRMAPIGDEQGITEFVTMTVEDVTTLRHLETVRRDFVANVSHELRTPIASINLLVETLQSGGMADAEAASHFLRRIQVETRSMNQLVEELLQLSRLESGRLSMNLEAVAVSDVLSGVRNRLAVMADEKHIALTVDVQADLPRVLVDFTALEQVLMNLVHNAIKFTPREGSVSMRARKHGRGVEIEIIDTGVGMDRGEAGRIFERFYKVDKGRPREHGTGLGLAIARRLLDLHGSRLQVISEPERGSRFSFELRLADG